MRVSEIGEWELLARIDAALGQVGAASLGVRVGRGDDVAVLQPDPGCDLLLETDEAVEGLHFRRDWASAEEIGARVATSGLSDIGAVGGDPRWVLLALSLPDDTEVTFVEGLVAGAARRCAEFGAVVVGGNLSGAGGGAVRVTVTVAGQVRRGAAVLRSGAREGDAVLVTGRPGLARAGLLALERSGRQAEAAPALATAVSAHVAPRPRVREARWLVHELAPRAMIDVSDGLVQDAAHIARASRVRIRLEPAQLHNDPHLRRAAAALGCEVGELVCGASDDYELLLTAAPDRWREVARRFEQRFELPLRRVGAVVSGAPGLEVAGAARAREGGGYTHFRIRQDTGEARRDAGC